MIEAFSNSCEGIQALSPTAWETLNSINKPWESIYPSCTVKWPWQVKSQLRHCRRPWTFSSVQWLSRVWLCDPMDCIMPGLPVHHQLPDFTQIHIHWVGDAIQLSHSLSFSSPSTFNLSQHQSLFKWVSSHQVAKLLEFQLQHQSFQWTLRTNLL